MILELEVAELRGEELIFKNGMCMTVLVTNFMWLCLIVLIKRTSVKLIQQVKVILFFNSSFIFTCNV